MVPSTLGGLLLFILLLAPGLAYVLRYERAFPAPPHSQFREALRVVFVSVTSLTVTGILVVVARKWFPGPDHTPNIRGLIRDPGPFFREHHVHLIWWALGVVVVATFFSAVAADARLIRGRRWLRDRK